METSITTAKTPKTPGWPVRVSQLQEHRGGEGGGRGRKMSWNLSAHLPLLYKETITSMEKIYNWCVHTLLFVTNRDSTSGWSGERIKKPRQRFHFTVSPQFLSFVLFSLTHLLALYIYIYIYTYILRVCVSCFFHHFILFNIPNSSGVCLNTIAATGAAAAVAAAAVAAAAVPCKRRKVVACLSGTRQHSKR